MSAETDRVNEILERLGSDYRAYTHAPVNGTFLAIIEALPSYIDRLIAERLALVDSAKLKASKGE
jgi:hypothetical protein